MALPDDLEAVTAAFAAALERADLVVTDRRPGTHAGRPDARGYRRRLRAEPTVDPELERGCAACSSGAAWRCRGQSQAGVADPRCVALANKRGSAPGWLVERPDGRVIVALPGPPREMRPMWRDEALPRLGRAAWASTRVRGRCG